MPGRVYEGFVLGSILSPDTNAPTLTNPQDGTPTSDGATGASVDTNEANGTLYWAVLTDAGTCTDAQLKAGSGGNIVAGKASNQAVSSTGTQTIANITGLTAGTNYELVYLQRDAAGNDSSQVTTGLTTVGGELAADPFTRADAGTLSSPWVDKNGALGIFSNQVDVTVTGDENIAYYGGVTWPADQYAEVTVKAAPAAGRAVAAMVRGDTGANRTGYFGGYDQAQSGDGNRRIWKFVGTTWTDIATDGVPVALNDVIRLRVVGASPCTLKLYVNGVEKISYNLDSAYATGNAGAYANNSAVDVPLLDLWSGGVA